MLLQTGLVAAQSRSAAVAEALFRKGREAMVAKNYDAACSYFEDSNELDPALGTLFNLALCERERGRVASAWSLYKKVLEKLPARDPRVPVAERAVAELEGRLSRLTVELAVSLQPGIVVTSIDPKYGTALHFTDAMLGVALPVDPGEYQLRVEAPGHETSEQVVQIGEAENRTITLELGAKAPPSPAPEPPPGPPEGPGSPGAEGDAPSEAEPRAPAEAEPAKPLPLQRFNASLLYPVALHDTKERHVQFELGAVYSEVGSLEWGATGGLLSAGRVRGVAWAFGATFVRGPTTGVAISNFFNVATGGLDGARIAGVANIQTASDPATAFESWGAQVASAANVVLGDFRGAQVAGLGNVVVGSARGPHIAIFMNAVTDAFSGLELSLLTNTAGSLSGAQIATVNVATGPVSGLQWGLVNVGGEVEGAQIGLFNYARRVNGVSLGLIPYSTEGILEPTIWGSTEYPGNIGLGFTTGFLTTRLSTGIDPNLAPEISWGHEVPIYGFFLEPEVGYRLDFDKEDHELVRYRFPLRVALGKRLLDTFGFFGGGGFMLDVIRETDEVELTPLAFLGASLYL